MGEDIRGEHSELIMTDRVLCPNCKCVQATLIPTNKPVLCQQCASEKSEEHGRRSLHGRQKKALEFFEILLRKRNCCWR